MTLFTRRTWLCALALACGTGAWAQGYPSRPVTFIVPFAAGSATDQLARALGQSITEQTKQAVVVDNKAGASGMLAAQAAARAPADGHTVLITTNTTHAANEHLYKKLPYDPVKDFAPVSGLGKGGQVLVVAASSPFKSVQDLLEFAKKNPGKLTFGSGSSSSRVAGELFQQMAGLELLHVPYKSNPLAITDLLGGQIMMMITDTSTGVPQVQAGKLRALGVTGSKRSPLLPNVPTIAEAGLPNYAFETWFMVFAPAGTPRPVIDRLNATLGSVLQSAAVKERMAKEGFEATPSTRADRARRHVGSTSRLDHRLVSEDTPR